MNNLETIKLEYLNGDLEEFAGTLKVLTCGWLEISRETETAPSAFLASTTGVETFGIPLSLLKKYTIIQSK